MASKAAQGLGTVLLALQLSACATGEHSKAAPSAPATQAPVTDKAFKEAVAQGDAAWQAADYERAVYYYVQAMNRRPDDAATLAKIGAIEDARGKGELAEKAFALAHASAPEDPRISERLARLYLREGKVDEASQLFSGVLALDAGRSRSLQGMGEVCLARSDFPQAVVYLDRALQSENPDKASILVQRGNARLQLNDLQGAEADLSSALQIAPSQPNAWRYLGDVQVRRGDNAAAITSLLHGMTTAEAYNEIGVVLLQMKDFAKASDFFSRAIQASPAWFEEAQKNMAVATEHLRGKS